MAVMAVLSAQAAKPSLPTGTQSRGLSVQNAKDIFNSKVFE